MKAKVLLSSLVAVAAFVIFLSLRQGTEADNAQAPDREGHVLVYNGEHGMLKDKITGQDVTFVNPQHVEIFTGDDVMYIQVDNPSGTQKNIITHKVPRTYPN